MNTTWVFKWIAAYGPADWTLVDREWQAKPVRAMVSAQADTALHDPASNNFGMLARLNRNGEPAVFFDPPVGNRYPLDVGKTWTRMHPMTVCPGCEVRPYEIGYAGEAVASLRVPAGTFQSYCILISDNFGQADRYWIGPEMGILTIKRCPTRPASHPQGAGHLDGELSLLQVAK